MQQQRQQKTWKENDQNTLKKCANKFSSARWQRSYTAPSLTFY